MLPFGQHLPRGHHELELQVFSRRHQTEVVIVRTGLQIGIHHHQEPILLAGFQRTDQLGAGCVKGQRGHLGDLSASDCPPLGPKIVYEKLYPSRARKEAVRCNRGPPFAPPWEGGDGGAGRGSVHSGAFLEMLEVRSPATGLRFDRNDVQ